MTSAADLRDLQRRPARYWHVDGLPELVMGAVWILWGLALLLADWLPRTGAANLYRLFVPAVLVLSGVLANWLVRRLKERVTYPRTGYVAYREPTVALRALTASVAVLAAATLAGLVILARGHGADDLTGAIMGVLFSLAFLVASVRQRAPHYLALAGVALALGLAAAAVGAGWDAATWMLLGLGAAAVVVGAVRLRRYLERHPAEEHA